MQQDCTAMEKEQDQVHKVMEASSARSKSQELELTKQVGRNEELSKKLSVKKNQLQQDHAAFEKEQSEICNKLRADRERLPQDRAAIEEGRSELAATIDKLARDKHRVSEQTKAATTKFHQ